MKMKPLLAIMALVMLAGCTTVSQEEYAADQKLLRGSPATMQAEIDRCVAQDKRSDASSADREWFAKLLNTSPAAAPRVFCTRLASALATNRLTYAEYRKQMASGGLTPQMIRILKGH